MLKIELSLFDCLELLQKNALPFSPKEDLSLSTYATQKFSVLNCNPTSTSRPQYHIFLASGIATFSTSCLIPQWDTCTSNSASFVGRRGIRQLTRREGGSGGEKIKDCGRELSLGKIFLFVFFLYFLLSCQSFCGQTMAKGIFEEYYSQVAIIACVPKFSVQKARKGADKVTLLLLQEPRQC